MSHLIERCQHKSEELLGDGSRLPENFYESLQPTQKLCVRLAWLLGRLTYGSCLWLPALKAKLAPKKSYMGKMLQRC